VEVTFVVEETEVSGENQQAAASHWETLSHNAVSSTPWHERDSNSQLKWHRYWLYIQLRIRIKRAYNMLTPRTKLTYIVVYSDES